MERFGKMTPHTPIPWKLSSKRPHNVIGYDPRLYPENEQVTIAMCGSVGRLDADVEDANAAHIVHCVNTHDALVEALEQLVICPAFNGQVFERDKESHRAWTLARQALQLAQHRESKQ